MAIGALTDRGPDALTPIAPTRALRQGAGMERPLDERTRLALAQIVDFATAGAQLVTRGRDAYDTDPMLKLAAEAVMRRLFDAISRLDEAFLAAHPSVDWSAMTMTRDLSDGPAGAYDEYWKYFETQLPVEVRRVTRILEG